MASSCGYGFDRTRAADLRSDADIWLGRPVAACAASTACARPAGPHGAVEQPASLTTEQISTAIAALTEAQILNQAGKTMMVREDVGRHNALDKLAGALAKEGRTGRAGAVILTSRISVEMVQKTAAIGAGVVVAMSALTALAVRTAEASGITLVGIARGSEFEIFSHPARVVLPSGSSVSRGLTAR
jgi:FdhD protein